MQAWRLQAKVGCCRPGMICWLFQTARFPIGTVIVNLSGCHVIGLLSQLAESQNVFTDLTRSLVFVGILGGYTTRAIPCRVGKDKWTADLEVLMDLPQEGSLLRILIGESDRYQGKPQYEWIVQSNYSGGLTRNTGQMFRLPEMQKLCDVSSHGRGIQEPVAADRAGEDPERLQSWS